MDDSLLEAMHDDVTRLTKEIKTTEESISLLRHELSQLEKELSHFLDSYYAALGPCCTTLSNLNQQLGLSSTAFSTDVTSFNAGDTASLCIKTLYRKLAKRYHPDTHAVPATSSHFFQQIHEAYQAEDLSSLLYFDTADNVPLANEEESLPTKWRQLSTHYDHLLITFRALTQKRDSLFSSAAFQLRQKVLCAKVEGIDLIAQIKDMVMEEIAEKTHMTRTLTQSA